MDVDEQRIRDFAYHIWLSEGEPEGHEMRHWDMARRLAESESSSAPVHVEEMFPDAVSNNPTAVVEQAQPQDAVKDFGDERGSEKPELP